MQYFLAEPDHNGFVAHQKAASVISAPPSRYYRQAHIVQSIPWSISLGEFIILTLRGIMFAIFLVMVIRGKVMLIQMCFVQELLSFPAIPGFGPIWLLIITQVAVIWIRR